MEGSCGREGGGGVVAGGQQVLVCVCWFSEQVRGDVLGSDRDGPVKVRDRLSKCKGNSLKEMVSLACSIAMWHM